MSSKERLHRLLDLAQVYRGWSRKRLGKALRRDASKLVPDSGIPKLDVVLALAAVLDWPVERVIDELTADESTDGLRRCPLIHRSQGPADEQAPPSARPRTRRPATLLRRARRLLPERRTEEVVDLARAARGCSTATAADRAWSGAIEAEAWIRQGRAEPALDRVRRTLGEPVPKRCRWKLQLQMADAYGLRWDLTESIGVSSAVLTELERAAARSADGTHGPRRPGTIPRDMVERAGLVDSIAELRTRAHAIRGDARRRLLDTTPDGLEVQAPLAAEDLRVAMLAAETLADEPSADWWARRSGTADPADRSGDEPAGRVGSAAFRWPEESGSAEAADWLDRSLVCRAGLLECEVAMGRRPVEAVVPIFESALDAVTDLDGIGRRGRLEVIGWWCAIGASIAMRSIRDERLGQRLLAVFISKAEEVVDRTEHWALRERVLTLAHEQERRISAWAGIALRTRVDDADLRVMLSAMGRVPHFRPIGWGILEHHQLLSAS